MDFGPYCKKNLDGDLADYFNTKTSINNDALVTSLTCKSIHSQKVTFSSMTVSLTYTNVTYTESRLC